MSKESDRQSVIRTTKVRTTLKADGSWIQRNSGANPEQEEDVKPWVAEVKANRTNGSFADSSPPTSPSGTATVPPAFPTTTEGSKPSSGYPIRGDFTQTNNDKSASVTNGTSTSSTTFVKKPTETYKKIAPHSLRLSSGSQAQDEDQLSPEEQSRRTDAASSVVRSSGVRQRSYVLSAAKKYETLDKPSDVDPSFVAKRVVFNEEDEPTKTQNDVQPPAPTPQSTVPQPALQPSTKDSKLAMKQNTVTETSPAKPSPEADTFTSLSDTLFPQKANTSSAKDTKLSGEQKTKTETGPLKPSSSDTKLPEQKTKTEASPAKPSSAPPVQPAVDTSKNLNTKDLISLAHSSEKLVDPLPSNPKSSSLSTGSQSSTKTTTTIQSTVVVTQSNVTEQKTGGDSPSKKKTITTSVTKTSDNTLDMFDPFPVDTSKSVKERKTDGGTKSSKQTTITSVTKTSSTTSADPVPVRTLSIKSTIDPLGLEEGPEDTKPMEFSDHTVDLLDPFSVDTSKSVKERKTDGGTKSSKQTTITSVTKTSSTTSADPVPVRTLSIKSTIDPLGLEEGPEDTKPMEFSDSTVDLLDPFSVDTRKSPIAPASHQKATEDVKRTDRMAGGALDALVIDVIPFDNTRISTEKLASVERKTEHHSESLVETTNDPTDARENYTITFERKSSVKDSPWDKWTSPTISEYREVKTYSSTPSTMDRTLETVDQEANSSDSESKKGVVLVKEYVNTSAMSLHNAGILSNERFSTDYVQSTSSSYSYSSPSSFSSGSMSACTYCGKMVGSENRITIEHLNISCHPACFKCGVCSKPMGDLLHSMFLHRNVVHCESCYSNAT